jgi:cytochrome c-type biogenesis protein CcmH
VRLSRTVLAALVVMLLVGSGATAGSGRPNVADLEAELVCPTCKTTLDQSDAPIARRMKAIIRARIASGSSAAEIKAELVDQFGPAVLAEPPKHGFDLLAWLLPLVGIAVGAVGLGALAVSWSRRTPDPGAAPLDSVTDPELEKRIDRELERVDE